MDTHTAEIQLKKPGGLPFARQAGLFMLFLVIGTAIFVFGSNYFSIFPTHKNLAYEGGLAGVLLIVCLLLRRRERLRPYADLIYLFFVACFVFFITTLSVGFRDSILQSLRLGVATSRGMAVAKLLEVILTVVTILVLVRIYGIELRSIYLQRGNLKWGLILGLGVLVNFLSSALMFFASRFSRPELLGDALLWGLVFSLANGFMEELWLRALFLRRLMPLIGTGGAILLTATWFALMHFGSVYFTPVAIPFFLANLLTFGLAWGYAMKKTDSLVGPSLMHAASDIFLFIATLASA
jgi:membrane protease YdiL (CAAX protease family)